MKISVSLKAADSLRSTKPLAATSSLRIDEQPILPAGGDGFLLEDESGVLLLETDDIILQE
jgi:hypothetical protein